MRDGNGAEYKQLADECRKLATTATAAEQKKMLKEFHLGDGLYASFDGFQFKLRAPRPGGDHDVYLDAGTLTAFLDFVADVRKRV